MGFANSIGSNGFFVSCVGGNSDISLIKSTLQLEINKLVTDVRF